MKNELEIECPFCHAKPGDACGVESHPERVQEYQESLQTVPAEKPEKNYGTKKK